MFNELNLVLFFVINIFLTSLMGDLMRNLLTNIIQQVRSPCHHERECYTSINQSIDQRKDFKSFNQPINLKLTIDFY